MKTKGIITKPRPPYWFSWRDNKSADGDTLATRRHKRLNETIAVRKKPYFMTYNYTSQRRDYNEYKKKYDTRCRRVFLTNTVEELERKTNKTQEEIDFIERYYKYLPQSTGNHLVNRIAKLFEEHYDGASKRYKNDVGKFDFNIMKSDCVVKLDSRSRRKIKALHEVYNNTIQYLQTQLNHNDSFSSQRSSYGELLNTVRYRFFEQCVEICPSIEILTDNIIDLLYCSNKSKMFIWDMCGEQIIENLLRRHDYNIQFPVRSSFGEFEYLGEQYEMINVNVKEAVTSNE